MHKLIADFLLKKKLDVATLSSEEKATFDGWQTILTGEKVTVEKIAEFCNAQKTAIESQWENVMNPTQKNERLIIMHTIFSKIARMIQAEEQQRVGLEKEIQRLIDADT